MFPDGRLNELAERKRVLRRRIDLRRRECVSAVARLAEPVEKIDRAVVQWRRISPLAKLAAVPFALLFKRTLFPRARILRSLLRWGPAAVGVIRGFRAARRNRPGAAEQTRFSDGSPASRFPSGRE